MASFNGNGNSYIRFYLSQVLPSFSTVCSKSPILLKRFFKNIMALYNNKSTGRHNNQVSNHF